MTKSYQFGRKIFNENVVTPLMFRKWVIKHRFDLELNGADE